MTLKAMYNNLADQYDMADQFGSITESHKSAIAQIERLLPADRSHFNVLDLGVGDGAFLKKLHQGMPDAEFTGVDVSGEMLKRAHEALDLKTIEASAIEVEKFLPPESQDLVLAHFINAYIPMPALFESVRALTKKEGYFSFITTTYDSFPVAQQYLADFIAEGTLLSSVVGHYYKSILKNTTVATGEKELLQAFGEYDFEILEHQRFHLPIVLNDIDALALFGIEGTWFLNSLSIKMLPKNFLLQRLKRLFDRIFTFPYHDTHVIDVVLAKK
ncbi:MAG: class I SAM-dependent methyltransferase [Gammaproteobacteria bacterium]|nr:class I SAM-dependent methyltransferase [Gammaproteobacteria bacterium]